jgi:hypothetical protein
MSILPNVMHAVKNWMGHVLHYARNIQESVTMMVLDIM